MRPASEDHAAYMLRGMHVSVPRARPVTDPDAVAPAPRPVQPRPVQPRPVQPRNHVMWFARSGLQPRRVTGEVLRDGSGAFFERVGSELQPLHHLVAGADGVLLDLMPLDCAPPADTVAATQPDAAQPLMWRALFAPGAVRRTLSLHAFRALSGARDGARRNQPGDRIACDVLIYEATAPQRRGELATSIEQATGVTAPLVPLDAALAARLALPAALRAYRTPRVLWREPDVVLPGERFVQLRIAGAAPVVAEGAPGSEPAGAHTRQQQPGVHAIPRRYTRPWEFRLRRSEALFAMHTDRSGVRGVLRRLVGRLGRRARLGRWRALLYGRTAQEQLWGVRPPARGYDDQDVVDWARRMLSAAGYDADRWLPEWELFWRRKGV